MDGSIVQAPGSSDVVLPLSVNGGQITYAGNAPGAILGLTQINFIWPVGAVSTLGTPISVQVGSSTSATVNMYGR
jgi:hypothetical protein